MNESRKGIGCRKTIRLWGWEICSSRLKVLADKTRLSVIQQLIEGPKQVNAINQKLKLEQSLLSHHLKILRESGLVRTARDGKAVRYQVSPDVVGGVENRAINLGCCELSFREGGV